MLMKDVIKFCARVLAKDTDGNVYLYLGDDDWSAAQYQWGFPENRIWFDTEEQVRDAAKFCNLIQKL
jgi:hypothetical protein